MHENSRNTELFDTLAQVLLRCWLFGLLLLLVWVAAQFVAGDTLFRLQGNLFDVTKHEFNLILYCSMALLKLVVLLFFFFPWLAIRLMLSKGKA